MGAALDYLLRAKYIILLFIEISESSFITCDHSNIKEKKKNIQLWFKKDGKNKKYDRISYFPRIRFLIFLGLLILLSF